MCNSLESVAHRQQWISHFAPSHSNSDFQISQQKPNKTKVETEIFSVLSQQLTHHITFPFKQYSDRQVWNNAKYTAQQQ